MGETKPFTKELTGAELQSKLKSNIHFKSLGGQRSDSLTLTLSDKEWWMNDKIGLFIHWGIYSVIGHGEWAKFNEQIPDDVYRKTAEEWIPKDFSTDEWLEIAKDLGAKYAVMVTRHHDGFALWDSPASYGSFTSAAIGAHRDYVAEFADSCRRYGLRLGLYYSLMDWRFPGYFDPKGLPENAALMKKQCYGQVEELCSRFRPDILWYDGGWLAHSGSDASAAWFWDPVRLNTIARKYNPKLLINPRSGWEGDFYCDEGSAEIDGNIIPVPWEKNMCICSGKSWGWMADDPVSDFDWLIRMMVNVVCRGGNWLLNIGPDCNGKISPEIRSRIHEIGEWLRISGDSIYGTKAGPFEPVDHIYGSTCRDRTIWLHVLDPSPFRLPTESDNAQNVLPEDVLHGNEILSARLFDGTEVPLRKAKAGYRLVLPELPAAPDTIVILTMRDRVQLPEWGEIHFSGNGKAD